MDGNDETTKKEQTKILPYARIVLFASYKCFHSILHTFLPNQMNLWRMQFSIVWIDL